MKVIKGKAISPGYGRGFAYIHETGYTPGRVAIPIPVNGEAESQRFRAALARAADELAQIRNQVAANLGDMNAQLLDAHLAFLNDPEFAERIVTRVMDRLVTAEQAISATVNDVCDSLSQADDPYLRERAQDIRDLGNWVLQHLALNTPSLLDLPPQSVLVAREFLPLDLLRIDRPKVAAIITEQGSQTSHTAILARSMGVPYVAGVLDATRVLTPGIEVLVDGSTGEVQIDPAATSISAFVRRKKVYDGETANAVAAEDRECVTLDGVAVRLLANIGHPTEAGSVLAHNLDGIGLFRTEYMFLNNPEPPGLEAQVEAYRTVVKTLAYRPLVIRTLDFGGDKTPAFVGPHFEANPSMGLRGLRFSLTSAANLFRVQLRAIIQANADANIGILFPMVLGGHDLRQAIAVLEEICQDEGVKERPRIGAMIETPSAVFMIDEILREVEFVSIGTNDLTQFMLAADRNAHAMMEDYSVLHPAVLRAIRTISVAASTATKHLSVCGEAASDPATACLLVGLGVRALSMSASSAARVRAALCQSNYSALMRVANEVLNLQSPKEIFERISCLGVA